MGASRHDKGKLRLDLIPVEWRIELGRLLTAGAIKYDPNNWKKGMAYSRCLGSLNRHLAKWEMGETRDEETNCHHLAAVAWNALALMYYELHGRTDLDDRDISDLYDSDLNLK